MLDTYAASKSYKLLQLDNFQRQTETPWGRVMDDTPSGFCHEEGRRSTPDLQFRIVSREMTC